MVSSSRFCLWTTLPLALLSFALAAPLARAEAPEAGDDYVIELPGFPHFELAQQECETEEGVTVCIGIDAASDVDGNISGPAKVDVLDPADNASFAYTGSVSGRVKGVAPSEFKNGRSTFQFRMDLNGMGSIAGQDLTSQLRLICKARAAVRMHDADFDEAKCSVKLCIDDVPGLPRFGCARLRFRADLDFPVDSAPVALAVHVDEAEGKHTSGDAALTIGGQNAANFVMSGKRNMKKGLGTLKLTVPGHKGKVIVKRLSVQGGNVSAARIIYRLAGHKGKVEIVP